MNAQTQDILQQNQNSFQEMQQQSAFQRRKNFFERKRFLNYQAYNPMDIQNSSQANSSVHAPSHSPLQETQENNRRQKGHPGIAHDRVPMDSRNKQNQHNMMNIEDNQ